MSQFLFQGDFRRRPVQNLGGSSRIHEQRDQVLQKAQEERSRRERERREQGATLKLQAHFRGYLTRKRVYAKWRQEFDSAIKTGMSQQDLIHKYLLMIDYFFNPKKPDDIARLLELGKRILAEEDRVPKFMMSNIYCETVLRRVLRKCVRCLESNHVRPAVFIRLIELFTDIHSYQGEPVVGNRVMYLLLKVWENLACVDPDKRQTIFFLYRRFLENKLPPMDDETDGNRFAESQIHNDYLRIYKNFMTLVEACKGCNFDIVLQSGLVLPANQLCQELMGRFAYSFSSAVIPIPTSDETTGIYVSPNGVAAFYIIPGLAGFVPLDSYLYACNNLSHYCPTGVESGSTHRCLLYMTLILIRRSNFQFTKENLPVLLTILVKLQEGVYFSEDKIPNAFRSLYGRGLSAWISDWRDVEEYGDIRKLFDNLVKPDEDTSFVCPMIVLLQTRKIYLQLVAVFNQPAVASWLSPFEISTWNLFSRSLAYIVQIEPKLSAVNLGLISSLSFNREFMGNLSLHIITLLRTRSRTEVPGEEVLSFCWFFSSLLSTLHDNEFFSRSPMNKENLGKLVIHLVNLYYDEVKGASFCVSTLMKATSNLLMRLHDRNCRMELFLEDIFISQQLSNISPVETHNLLFSDFSRNYEELGNFTNNLEEVMLTVLKDFPFLLSFHDRVKVWNRLLNQDRQTNDPNPMAHREDVQIRRNFIYEDAFEKLSPENVPDIRRNIRISLVNVVGVMEAGIDGGGLLREFLTEATKAAVDPNRGLFRVDSQNRIYPNPIAKRLMNDFRKHFFVIGRLVGKSLYEQTLLELPMAAFFIQYCIEGKVHSAVDFLATLDPALHKNLLALKTFVGDFNSLGLDFTLAQEELGETSVVELKANGRDISVDASNVIEYIHLVADFKINKEMEEECRNFRAGMMDVIPHLRMFSWKELQSLISGSDKPIDVDDWRANTNYGPGFIDTHPTIEMFWQVVRNFDEKYLRMLLKFVTSCSRPPLLGFKDLVPKFGMTNAGKTDRLPTAATCMNLLKLPEFEDPQTLKDKLMYAINAQAGFELS